MFKFIKKYQASQKKKSIRKVVAFSLVSSMICSSIVFLLAPKKGSESRKDVVDTAKNVASKFSNNSIFKSVKEKFGKLWQDSSQTREKYFEKVTQKANELKENLKHSSEEEIKK